jgi:hypothetical protein
MTRTAFQLAATLLTFGVTAACAQITTPSQRIPTPPGAHAQAALLAKDDLQWLWPYTRPTPLGNATDLRLDERFQTLVTREFKQPQAMWGGNPEHRPALASIVPLFVSGYGTVTAKDNRYIAVDGCVRDLCSSAGMLWIDLGMPGARTKPLMVFAATTWIAEGRGANEPGANYEMWLFPNRNLDPNALPLALTTSISEWNARLAASHRLVPHVTQALLVEPDGLPHALNADLAGANTIAPQTDTATPQPEGY